MMTDLILHHLHFQVMNTIATSLLYSGLSSSDSLELLNTTDSSSDNYTTCMIWLTLKAKTMISVINPLNIWGPRSRLTHMVWHLVAKAMGDFSMMKGLNMMGDMLWGMTVSAHLETNLAFTLQAKQSHFQANQK